ncbi:MAG: hypothetical protein COV36_01590 [Alphaproteobacteria bacterium CG11_big_fil_rev_8_21_14_0_20_44_7]|nr:MAG: hypothetical protein COV36_01590 [Alphaproteobacteria bacterium CG11_big_fil_rev_8_21_14_0_20_44_7]
MKISRRNFVKSVLASGLILQAPAVLALASETKILRWDGVALGADSSIQIAYNNKNLAEKILRSCLAEIKRLEAMFSLYENDSVISLLNDKGFYDNPPQDFVNLIRISKYYGEKTYGNFDITIQPLWEYFSENSQAKDAPAKIRELVDYRNIIVENNRIYFAKPHMKISLNGIAQGYITDRITSILRKNAVKSALVDLGEKFALGKHPNGEKWRIGIQADSSEFKIVELEDMAISTSSMQGGLFAEGLEKRHIFMPKQKFQSKPQTVTILADNSTKADALSTAIAAAPQNMHSKIMTNFANAELIIS